MWLYAPAACCEWRVLHYTAVHVITCYNISRTEAATQPAHQRSCSRVACQLAALQTQWWHQQFRTTRYLDTAHVHSLYTGKVDTAQLQVPVGSMRKKAQSQAPRLFSRLRSTATHNTWRSRLSSASDSSAVHSQDSLCASICLNLCTLAHSQNFAVSFLGSSLQLRPVQKLEGSLMSSLQQRM